MEEVKEPIVKPGEIWQLGNHRLMCGDATVELDVQRLMDGTVADMCFTDPPYNVDYGELSRYRGRGDSRLKNDNMSKENYKSFCVQFINNIKKYVKYTVYICGASKEDGRILHSIADEHLHCSTTVIWNKHHFSLGRGKYQNKYEPIWFGWVQSGKTFTDARNITNIWDVDKPTRSALHPTIKPLELVEKALEHNPKAESVLDLFGGSGSTLIACEALDRACYMMELEPKYCDVIINQWEEYLGETAVRIAGGVV